MSSTQARGPDARSEKPAVSSGQRADDRTRTSDICLREFICGPCSDNSGCPDELRLQAVEQACSVGGFVSVRVDLVGASPPYSHFRFWAAGLSRTSDNLSRVAGERSPCRPRRRPRDEDTPTRRPSCVFGAIAVKRLKLKRSVSNVTMRRKSF